MTVQHCTNATLIFFSLLFISPFSAIAQDPAVRDQGSTEAKTKDALDEIKEQVLKSKRLVFLGDSNTNAGEFIVQIEGALLDKFGYAPEMINLGLPSETCSGLSEPIHPFPRPNVLERLDRALEKTKPEIVISCYGMNDGIYHPFDETRFATYQSGTQEIIAKVKASGAKLILLTPPPFDPLPYRRSGKLVPVDGKEFSWKTIYENYDAEVMKVYADWVMDQRDRVWVVVDTHSPLNHYLSEKRKSQSDFAFSNDGVHFDAAGHAVFAQAILESLGFGNRLSENENLLNLVRQRQSISHPAWLSEVGHLRPGVKAGLPINEAEAKIKPLSVEIAATLAGKKLKQ